jgi:hypothetical protein
VSRERLGNVLPETDHGRQMRGGDRPGDGAGPVAQGAQPATDPDAEAEAFVRFCYRRRAVAWPELYDEMCAVAARGEYRGLGYEQLERIGIRFALPALPRLCQVADRVIAEERGPQRVAAVA